MSKNVDDILVPELEEGEDNEEVNHIVEEEKPQIKEKKKKVMDNYMPNAVIDIIERFLLEFKKDVAVFDKKTKTSKREEIYKYAKEIALFPKLVRVKREYSTANKKEKEYEDIPASYLVVSYEDIQIYAAFSEEGKVLEQLVEEDPDLFIKFGKTAISRILKEIDPEYHELVANNIDIGISDYLKMKEIPELSVNDEGKLLYMEGNVINKDGSTVPKVTQRAWECAETHTVFTDSDVKALKKCTISTCGAPIIKELINYSSKIDTVGFELQQKTERSIGGFAQTIECLAKGHEKSQLFLNDITPGNMISIDGILRIEYSQGRKGLETKKFLEVTSFRKQKDSELFKKDDMIAELVKQVPKDPFEYYDKVVDSIAPNIFGRKYKRIKEAALMVAIGNLAKKDFSGTRYRGDILMLLVGSPSTAKSEIMRYIESIDPRAKYASSLSSKSGFTVGALLTDDTRRLSYGIIPLSHRGTALIDEIDKLNHEAYNAIIECTDDNQTLNYDKAGFHVKIPCHCGHIHACNSNKNNGDYNPYLPFYEQVDLPAALISRYDLIFVVQGLDDDEDEALIKHLEKIDATLVAENEYTTENVVKNAIDSQELNVFDKKYMIHLRDYLRSIPPSKRPKLISGSPAWQMLQNFIMRYKKAKHLRFLDDPESNTNPDLIDLRKRRTGRNIAEIIALIMRDSDKVEVHHMERAIALMETSLASLIPKSREAGEDDLSNTKTRAAQQRDIFSKLSTEARKQTIENLKIAFDKRVAVLKVIHQLAKQSCSYCKGRGKIIEEGSEGFGMVSHPCKSCKTRGWTYESFSHTDMLSYIIDQGRTKVVIYQKELENIIKEFLELDDMKFIRIDKTLKGNSIRYRPTLEDLTGVQAALMIAQYVDPLDALELKIRKGEIKSEDGEDFQRGPNIVGMSKSAETNAKSVNKELERMGVIVDKIDTKETLEDVLDERGVRSKKGGKYYTG